MKPIKITTENAAAIEAALKAVNGRATTHTFTMGAEIILAARAAEERLADLDLPKADRAGARYSAQSGERLPSAYNHRAATTSVTLLRRAAGWYLVEVHPSEIWGGNNSPRAHLTLTEAQDAKAVEVLRRRYSVARPMTAASAEEVAEIADAANAARHARDVAYAHEGTEA